MTTTPVAPATPSPANTAAPPTPTEAPAPTPTVTVTGTTSETVQVVPSPIEVRDAGGMDVSDWTAIGSLAATLILLYVTWRAFRTNKMMADEAARSAKASLLAALAAQESSAITAAEIDLNIVADPGMQGVGFFPSVETLEENEARRKYMEATNGDDRNAFAIERDRLAHQRKKRDAEAKKQYEETETRHRLWLSLRVNGASVLIHRVVLVEYPGTRNPWGSGDGLGGPARPESYWRLRPHGSLSYPLPAAKGEELRFRMDRWWEIRPDTAMKFLARNALIVEYSFGSGTERRLARAHWDDNFWMSDEVGDEKPIVAPVLSLPDVLTNEEPEPEPEDGATATATADEPASNVGSIRSWTERTLRRLADRIGGNPGPAEPVSGTPAVADPPAANGTEPETVTPVPAQPDAQDDDLRNEPGRV